MAYELFYFPFGGRGEQVRVLLHALDQAFEDTHVPRDKFIELKGAGPGTLPFGSMPVLKDDDFVLAQGPAILAYLGRKHGLVRDLQSGARADSLALAAEDLRMKYFALFGDGAEEKQATFLESLWRGRWLQNFEGLLELNGDTGFFVGDSMTHGDIAVWDVLDAVTRNIPGATLDGFPKLVAFYESVGAHSPLKAYTESRTT